MTTDFSGYYKKTRTERIALIKEFASLTAEQAELLESSSSANSLHIETAEKMIENVVSVYGLPYAIAPNFLINGKEYAVPMVVEEASVVAAASHMAKLCKNTGGFTAKASNPIMIGQIQLAKVKNFETAKHKILEKKTELLILANSFDPLLVKMGGGAKDIEVREVQGKRGNYLVVHLLVDVRDAMGANAVNTMCEKISSNLEEITGGEKRLRILSNLAIHRTVKVSGVWSKEDLGGLEAVERILDAFDFAQNDMFRACTHNKGIMNGISAVTVATGNDWRAIEAGAHAFAARNGNYTTLSWAEKTQEGNLKVSMEIPLAVGIVGGATKVHPLAQLSLKILNIKTASELAEIIACVGLANNVAAVRALAMEGIQEGHMKLHAKNMAVSVGAQGKEIEKIAEEMIKIKQVRMDIAEKLLKEIRK
ncbi:MAG: hydroxymethylglutaryl-CoA reductase, degradative [Candidatus Diapherotrites archaeon]|nr:hydroxymethylglutaryl-CoA reductase, degradative [Candidatus Diapherotrites archaeon]